MLESILAKVFGTKNEREIKAMRPMVAAINDLEPPLQQLSDIDLAAKTIEFKERIAKAQRSTICWSKPSPCAAKPAAASSTCATSTCSLIGGIVLHRGNIAEMKTGEGKTLVATLPFYLNALEGKGVHVVTVNDYLASRDSEWMGRIHQASWASPSA